MTIQNPFNTWNQPFSQAQGIRAAIDGLRDGSRALQQCSGSRALRKQYLWLSLLIGIVALLLQGSILWFVWGWTSGIGAEVLQDPSWWDSLIQGAAVLIRFALRAMAVVIMLLLGPLLALQGITALAPVVAEQLFYQGYRELDQHGAQLLATQKGYPIVKGAVRSILRAVRLILFSLLFALLGYLPGIGIVVVPLAWLYMANLLGQELLDPFWDREELRQKRKALDRQNRAYVAGVSIPLAGMLTIPLVGPFFFPLVQASAGNLVAKSVSSQTTKLDLAESDKTSDS